MLEPRQAVSTLEPPQAVASAVPKGAAQPSQTEVPLAVSRTLPEAATGAAPRVQRKQSPHALGVLLTGLLPHRPPLACRESSTEKDRLAAAF